MDLYQHFIALSQIIIIDFVLAGDNAIVVGMAASRVHPSMRARVILWGIGGAVVLRILFAAIATQLLTIVGLTLAGGILLLWVCWKMYREITLPAPAMTAFAGHSIGVGLGAAKTMTFGAALTQIVVADVSMSLDNVLAVAGAAKGQDLGAGGRPDGGGGIHGAVVGLHRQTAGALPLDHLDRACDRALRRDGNDMDRHVPNRLPVR